MNTNDNTIIIRRAKIDDIRGICALLNTYAERTLLLPLSREKTTEMLPNFLVAENNGDVIGCVALRDFGDALFEVRSLAVKPSMIGKGLGSRLVTTLIREFEISPRSRLFALTYRSDFFQRLGFHLVDKKLFPQKIWSDCDNCPKKDHCDEQAVLATIPLE